PAQAGSFIVKAYRFGLVSGGVGTALAVSLAPVLATSMINAPELIPVLRLAALLVFFGAVNGVQNGILAGLASFRPLAFAAILRGIACCVGMAWGAMELGLWGALAGQLAAEVVSAVAYHLAILRSTRAQGIPLVSSESSADLRAFSGFALPTLLATIVL